MSLPPTGPGLTLALVSIILLVLSWLTVFGRLFVRRTMTIKGVSADDWLMVAGLMLYTVACQATISAAYNGVGMRDKQLNDYYDREGRKWFMLFQLFYAASIGLIKCSTCATLLRISASKKHIWSLYTIIFLSCIAALTTDITVLAWCKPVSATWDKRTGTCVDASIITNIFYFISTISVITDFSCAILPAFIIWKVRLRFRIKASIAVILALGILASIATLVRLRYLFNYNNPRDHLYNISHIAIWSIIESGTGLIAGSLPVLRPLLRYLPFLGGKSEDEPGGRETVGAEELGALAYRRSVPTLDMLYIDREGGGSGGGVFGTCEICKRYWEERNDMESQTYILQENEVAVTRAVESNVFNRSRFND